MCAYIPGIGRSGRHNEFGWDGVDSGPFVISDACPEDVLRRGSFNAESNFSSTGDWVNSGLISAPIADRFGCLLTAEVRESGSDHRTCSLRASDSPMMLREA